MYLGWIIDEMDTLTVRGRGHEASPRAWFTVRWLMIAVAVAAVIFTGWVWDRNRKSRRIAVVYRRNAMSFAIEGDHYRNLAADAHNKTLLLQVRLDQDVEDGKWEHANMLKTERDNAMYRSKMFDRMVRYYEAMANKYYQAAIVGLDDLAPDPKPPSLSTNQPLKL